MDFSRIRYQSLIGKLIRLPLRLIPKRAALPILQGRHRGMRWIVGSGNHGYWLGSHEYRKRILFEQTVRPGDVVYDIGAHVGFYTLLASALVGTKGRVIAFEPLPDNLAFLHEHLRLNRRENVTVMEMAVSDFEGTAEFLAGDNTSTGHLAEKGTIPVRVVSLDKLVERGEILLPQVIKMDIEGAEGAALRGARKIFAEARPVLFLATHDETVHRECMDWLHSLDYALQPVEGFLLETSRELIAIPVERKPQT